MTSSANLNILHLSEGGGANAEVLTNNAINMFDTLTQCRAISKTLTAQPGSPTDGDVYLLGTTHTGTDWASRSRDDIAFYYSGWYFLTPKKGFTCYVVDESVSQLFDGKSWVPTLTALHSENILNDLVFEGVGVVATPTGLTAADNYKAWTVATTPTGQWLDDGANRGDIAYWLEVVGAASGEWQYIDATTIGAIQGFNRADSLTYELTDLADIIWQSATADRKSVIERVILQQTTTSDTNAVMTTDAATATVNNSIRLDNNHTIYFRINALASETGTAGNAKAWEVTGTIERYSGTTALVDTINKTVISENSTDTDTWDLLVTADNTLDVLKVEADGDTSTNIKWVASVDLIQIN